MGKAYDKAKWHYEGDYPKDLPTDNATTHIGMFLAWAIANHLEGELHREHSKEALEQVRRRQMTGPVFLIEQCDEALTNEDLNDVGNAFATAYYELNQFNADYESALGKDVPTLYHIADTWENYDRIAAVIDRRFKEWKGKAA